MRHRHEPALRVDAVDRLLGREVALDGLLEEQPDDLALAGRDLLADDHPEAVREVAEAERALDSVVVRREDDVEAGGLDRERLHGDRCPAVRRVLAVRVHVDLDGPFGRRAAHFSARPSARA